MIITNKKLDNPTKRNEHTHPKVGMSSTMVTLEFHQLICSGNVVSHLPRIVTSVSNHPN